MQANTATAIALLLLTAALSGCVGGSDVNDEAGPNETGRENEPDATGGADPDPGVDATAATNATLIGPDRIELAGCTEQIGLMPFPAGVFDQFLPPGFESVPFEDAPGTVTVFAHAASCTAGLTNGTDHGPATMMSGGLIVDPPDEYAASVDVHALVVEGYIDVRAIAALVGGWGGGFYQGPVSFGVTDAGAVRAGTAGAGAMHLTTAAPTGVDDGDGYTVRVFGASDGALTGAVDMRTGDSEGSMVGTASMAVEDVPAFAFPPGVGIHRWGPSYTLVITPADLALDGPDAQEGAG